MAKLDGKGMDPPKASTPQASVEGTPHKDVPGGESSSGKWIDQEGPNPGRAPGKK